MPIQFTCECGQALQAREEHAGKRLRCPSCGCVSVVPPLSNQEGIQAGTPPSPGGPAEVESAVERAEPDRPERRRSRDRSDADADQPPRRREPARTSGKAIASLVLGLLAFCLSLIAGIPAIILGILALRDIGRSRRQLTGSGLAVAGIVTGSLGLLITPILIALLVPAVQKVREAAMRTQDSNNLKQMALAMHNYHDTFKGLPEDAAIRGKDGRPLLSWRVALLPYIEQEPLYRQFHRDEPWDSPHNMGLLKMMPAIYGHPGDPQATSQGLTCYRVFVGPQSAFTAPAGRRPGFTTSITDGTPNTIMIVEATTAVPWTKPDELVYDPNGPLPPLGGRMFDGFNVAMWDGSVRFVKKGTVPEPTLRALITANGGDNVPLGW